MNTKLIKGFEKRGYYIVKNLKTNLYDLVEKKSLMVEHWNKDFTLDNLESKLDYLKLFDCLTV